MAQIRLSSSVFPNIGVYDVVVQGPAYTVAVPAGTGGVTFPGTVAASGTFTSGLVLSQGMPHIAASAEITQAGTLIIQRYLDTAGAIPLAPVTGAMVAGTLEVLDNNDGKLFQSFKVSIVNGGGSVANVTAGSVVLSAR